MKQAVAIIEGISAQSLALVKAKVRALTDAEQHEAKALERHATARELTSRARLELGQALAVERARHPVSGPGAKRWSEFLLAAGIGADKAKDAIRYAEVVAERFRGALDADAPRDERTRLPSMAEAGIDLRPRGTSDPDDDDDGQTGAKAPPTRPAQVLFAELTADQVIDAIKRLKPEDRKRVLRDGKANVKGGSGEVDRGTWCTSSEWARAVGTWDHDPFSNPRSHIASVTRCMLEDGGDAFGGGRPGEHPGNYLLGERHGSRSGVADELTRVWIQPPYDLVPQAIAHYGHTRFCALLRWSPDVKAWFPDLWKRTAVVCHPVGERMEFEPPPGVEKSGDMPFPHALFYAHAADVTDEVRARCIVHEIDHGRSDPAILRTALRLVE